jgi:hypothetical protein
MSGRISALFLLALGLVKTLLLRFVRLGALRAFDRKYGAEGIHAVQQSDAAVLSQAGRCISCGRCDADEGARIAQSAGAYRGMMHFVLSGNRSLPDYDAVARMIQAVPEQAFERAALECPTEVPLLSLARLVRSHGAKR